MEKPINHVIKKHNCSGCGACQNICPNDAISMKHEVECTIPIVDNKKCIECGLCIKVCPINKNDEDTSEKIYPIIYACRLKDTLILKNSTSGGIFIALARKVISEGGIVFGAILEKDFRVNIGSVEEQNCLAMMQGSKYVESNTRYTFREVEKKLKEGRICLYTALPCQIGGLLSYLKMRKVNCDNLYTADLVCHGTPSEEIYLSYINDYKIKNNLELRTIKHRYKNHNWNSMVPQTCAYISDTGKKKIYNSFKDGYLNGFLQGKIYKEYCYKCKYAKIPRIADFTFGDFTGLGAIKKYKNNYKCGVSQLLINTAKGKNFFDKVKSDLIFEKRDIYEALFFNKNLYKPSCKPKDTDYFFTDFKNEVSWDDLRKKYFDKNTKNKRIMFIKSLITKLFGAKLTTKAMYYLKRNTMSPETTIQDINDLFQSTTTSSK